MTQTQWGRKETVIFPPHSPIYTYGAIFFSLVITGLCVYLHFAYAMTPLQRFYLPYYLRTGVAGMMHKTDKYQLLSVGDAERRTRAATETDVQEGSTPSSEGKPIPLELSGQARQSGVLFLYRQPKTEYLNKPLHDYFERSVYDGESLWAIFRLPVLFGIAALLLQLPFSIRKDIKRRKQMKYGRRLKGPVLVSPREFNKAIQGDGIGFKTLEAEPMMRIPQRSEGQHIELMGDTGAGKTTLIMQLLRQIQARGQSAIVYDPACEFVQRFYDKDRQDIILNPLDKRCPYWGPSEELRRRAEAKAIAASLYQPTTDRKGEFFVETPQKIFAHLLTFGPTPEELVHWMANPDEIDRRVQGTEMASMIAKGAQQQRNGVLASLGLIADSLRMLPTKEKAETAWSATEWAERRQGWIFITSKPSEREALRPLHSLWIDLLVLRLLNEPKEDQRPVWFVLDELASLQRLPQLHTAITENRKSRNPLVLGFQGKAQLEVIYGHMAEVMLSQPATKIFLKTTEPKAAEWVSNAIGKVEIERMRETHFDGTRSGKNFALDRQVEPLVLDSEISGLADKHAFLKLGNHVARFSFAYTDIPAIHPAFVPRPLEDDDLAFDPKTLQKKPPKSAPIVEESVEDEDTPEPQRSSYSMGM
ncbi:type IV secretion system DNA-binding domain-containing protein [Tunturibacter empetritectus]|uniref:Energy-coupling factor transporter ATP-binding protein EcfA2 n=1 Tax=Tunturiibacter empetritectus TaxID=3069691 RepID=A0A7W8MRC6_9BACT|nr:type IV secretion system DNA-binding domain-containing protein [Edaphobacter lichenicola]MBB5316660.1 energy-coupling factor transporter ATP-binding protein EcfA2 [Edaphobacter lichenicola]